MLKVDREKFLESFAAAVQVAPQKTPKPILQNVKLTASPNAVKLFATDYEFSIEIDAEGADTFKPGTALLPAARALAILREMTADRVSIDVENGQASIYAGKSRFRFQTEEVDKFPVPEPLPDDLSLLTLPAAQLRSMLRKTMFATDPDSARYAIGGVKFEAEGGAVFAYATDCRQASCVRFEHAGDEFTPFAASIIVPTHSCQLIDKLAGGLSGDVRIGVFQNDFFVRAESLSLRARLLSGNFPRRKSAFTRESGAVRAVIDREELLSALRQVAIVTTADSRGIDFNFSPESLSLSARTATNGDSQVELPCQFDGDAKGLTLDSQKMLEFLKACEDGNIEFLMKSRALIVSAGSEYAIAAMETPQAAVAQTNETAKKAG